MWHFLKLLSLKYRIQLHQIFQKGDIASIRNNNYLNIFHFIAYAGFLDKALDEQRRWKTLNQQRHMPFIASVIFNESFGKQQFQSFDYRL